MIIRNRRKREKLLRRFSDSLSRVKPPAGNKEIMREERFQLEIAKETQRSNRRTSDPEFAIVSLDFCDYDFTDEKLTGVINEFIGRLRVSDSIGWHRLKLAILLPETGLDGARLVCDSLLEIVKSHEVEMDAVISIYPWDDLLHGPHDSEKRPLNKGSKGPKNEWVERTGNFDPSSLNPKFTTKHSDGSVATLARPTQPVAQKSPSVGTGVRMAFNQSKATPIWKRVIDITGAGIGLMLLSPILLCTALAIKATSKGPVLFRQRREGKDGEVFHIFKFRTMCVDAEEKKDDLRQFSEQDGPAFKLKDDPRVTRLGKYLRKSCIDELPQLLNVVAGEMSIVGPRPLPVNESQQCLPWQRQRLTVLPGLTCTWQARGGRDIKFSEWMRMDLDYIEQRGFWFDLQLIGETALVVVLHKGSV